MEKGRAHHSSLFMLRSASVEDKVRVSATVPNRIAKKAVLRNRMRRKMYEAIRLIISKIKDGQHTIIFAKSAATTATQEQLDKEMVDIFVKAGLLR
jgi:ribonuclease P protein component